MLQYDKSLANMTKVPDWSAYNSLISDPLPTTRVATPLLVAAPAYGWSTLFTVLMQAQSINTKVVRPARKTIISLDLAPYQSAKKLQITRNNLDLIILRPGELHIVMVQLRTIGASIDNSGLDMCWMESELYGASTVKQIIEGGNFGRRSHVETKT